MYSQYNLIDKTVGETYMYLVQIRGEEFYTGDGVRLNINTSSGSISIEQNFISEELILNNGSQYLLSLGSTPDTQKPISVSWNGLLLREGASNDYTVSGKNITVNPAHDLEAGDVFVIGYYS